MNEDMKHADSRPNAPLDNVAAPPGPITEAAAGALNAISAWVLIDKLIHFREVGADLRKAFYDANDKLSKALAAPPALNAPDSPLGGSLGE